MNEAKKREAVQRLLALIVDLIVVLISGNVLIESIQIWTTHLKFESPFNTNKEAEIRRRFVLIWKHNAGRLWYFG